MNKRINKILSSIENGNILHVGCTGGLLSKPEYKINTDREDEYDINLGENSLHLNLINKFGQDRVYGIDISEEKITYFRDNLEISNLDVASAESYSSNIKYTNIILTEVIEHLNNPGNTLVNLSRMLDKNSQILITTPYAYSIFYPVYAWLNFPNTTQNKEHTMLFCPSTIKVLTENSGLILDRFELISDHPTRFKNKTYKILYFFISQIFKLFPKKIYAKTLFAIVKNK